MKIDQAALQQVLQTYQANNAAAAGKATPADQNPTSGSDEISISPEAQQLQGVIAQARLTEDVRTEQVEEIRTKLRTGAYMLDPQAIANKMLGLGKE